MKRSLVKISALSVLLLTMVSCKDKVDYSRLDRWKGIYTVTAESYSGDAQVPPVTDKDETWTVTVTKVEGSDSRLAFTGIGAADALTVYATLDPDAMTISFEPGQGLGDIFDYGNVSLFYATDDIAGNADSDIPQEYVDAAASMKIPGTLSSDGGIFIDRLAEIVEGPYVWEVFKTTWVKQK